VNTLGSVGKVTNILNHLYSSDVAYDDWRMWSFKCEMWQRRKKNKNVFL